MPVITNFKLLVILLIFAMLCGCKKSGVNRLDVKGNITWKGQPIPTGVILFDPDVAKQNKGPQGYAIISNGKYDTAGERGKGCVAGPHTVVIQGCDGKDIRQFHRFGNSLFQAYETTIDIPKEGGQIDFVVPESVKPPVKAEVD